MVPLPSRFRRAGLGIVALTLAATPLFAQDFDQYREFRIGSSTASVFTLTGAKTSELKTLHERPAVLQELTWRPRYAPGRPIPDREAVREMVFSFYDDQLFRIAIQYERDRTVGLTTVDMVEALSTVYGTQMPVASRRPQREHTTSLDSPTPVAQWRSGNVDVLLNRSGYNDDFGLTIVSTSLELLARKAQAASVVIDRREAPARDAARKKQQDDDARAAENAARTINKAGFRP
jgi:hypothetical protein